MFRGIGMKTTLTVKKELTDRADALNLVCHLWDLVSIYSIITKAHGTFFKARFELSIGINQDGYKNYSW